ncbi:MAG: hypothetical protein OEM89_01745 [Nitrosopumilus sp.]|nr:hypothetical protein [Nitrosopumilus sp.]
MRPLVASLIAIITIGVIFGSAIESSFAQTSQSSTTGQTTLSGDLENNPLAQDILEKIEQTKQWIEDLEKREYEKTKAQKELEEKRAIAIERLNQDLIEWENLWANYTSRAAFERFVEDKPTPIQGVFWDQFEFKEMKVSAGRTALKEVIANGGSLSEARAAYHKAAETKRIELIEMNAQFNVKHNLAFYKQQLLFNSTGQLPQNLFTQSQLAEYYTDYRSDPQYLSANPNDKYAYESLNTSPDTKCRDGYVVIHRLQSDDYACITESTAEMWERRGMGKIVNANLIIFDENSLSPNIPTNPGTLCQDEYIVVFHNEAKEYACVLESTAQDWIDKGKAEIHELTQFIFDKDKQKEIENQIFEINQEIDEIYDNSILNQIQLKKEYDIIYKDADLLAKQDEKELLDKYYSEEKMTTEELSKSIMKVRENNELNKEKILEDKADALEKLKLDLHRKMQQMASEFEDNSEIKLVWNSDSEKYRAENR